MSSSMFERHPDQDVLADLAAEVLPEDQARAVEAHVIGCRPCGQLLADAERVRRLLVSEDPGPMPDDVWRRIEASLNVEAVQLSGTRDYRVGPPPPPPLDYGEAPTAAWRAFKEEVEPPPPVPMRRPVPQNRRRDVRTEERTSQRRLRPGTLLAAAAAGLGVVAVGGFGVVSLLRGGDQGGSAVNAALPGSATTRNVVTTSGVDYTAATLTAQVGKLVGSVGTHTLVASMTPSKPAASSKKPTPVATAGTVAVPERLQACLSALGEGGKQAVAVDLARYQGREAAVIVLPRSAGGYDVWVVARDCQPGREGELAFRTVKG